MDVGSEPFLGRLTDVLESGFGMGVGGVTFIEGIGNVGWETLTGGSLSVGANGYRIP